MISETLLFVGQKERVKMRGEKSPDYGRNVGRNASRVNMFVRSGLLEEKNPENGEIWGDLRPKRPRRTKEQFFTCLW